VSQYPSPYSPPPYYPQYAGYYAQRDLLAPARRASWLMFALAAMLCFCGVCMGGISRVNLNDLPPESRMEFDRIESQLKNTGLSLKTMLIITGAMAFVPGIAMAVLAIFVRRGGIVSLVLSLALDCVLILGVAFIMLSSLAAGPQAMAGICVWAFPMAGFILLMVWLIQAMRAGPQITSQQSQYAAYYQQYQQAQQAYLQTYGYAAPPAPQQQQQQPPPAPPQQNPPTQGPTDAPPQG
jgi:hypothetical protein